MTVKSVASTANGSMIRNGNGNGTAAKLTINGGTFTDATLNTVKNEADATAIINGGAFTNSNQHVILNSGSMELNGGTFEETKGSIVIENYKGDGFAGDLTVDGATVKPAKAGYSAISPNGPVTIKSISVVGSTRLLYNNTSNVTYADGMVFLYDGNNLVAQTTEPVAGEYKVCTVNRDGAKSYYKSTSDITVGSAVTSGSAVYLWDSMSGTKSLNHMYVGADNGATLVYMAEGLDEIGLATDGDYEIQKEDVTSNYTGAVKAYKVYLDVAEENATYKVEKKDGTYSYYSSTEKMETISEDAKVITLMKDVSINSTVVIYSDAKFDLNGHTINNAKGQTGIYAFADSGAVIITDSSSEGTGAIINGEKAKNYGIVNLRHDTVIAGGTYTSEADGYVITFTYNMADYNYEITGGTFNGKIKAPGSKTGTLVISGGTFSVDPSAYVKDGYVAVANEDGTYTVQKVVAMIDETAYTSLATAIDAAKSGDTIALKSDVSESISIAADKNITIDLNGYTLQNANAGEIVIDNAGTLTLKDSKASGLIESTDGANYTIQNTGTLTIEDGVTVKSVASTANGSMIRNGNGNGTAAKLTINGGTFTDATLNTVKNEADAVAIINGGTFTNSKQRVILNAGSMELNGGTFEETNTSKAGNIVIENYKGDGFAGDLTVDGATVKPAKSSASAISADGPVTIKAISVVGSKYLLYNNTGDVTYADGMLFLYDGNNLKAQTTEPDAGEYKVCVVKKDGTKSYYKTTSDITLNNATNSGTTVYLWDSISGKRDLGYTHVGADNSVTVVYMAEGLDELDLTASGDYELQKEDVTSDYTGAVKAYKIYVGLEEENASYKVEKNDGTYAYYSSTEKMETISKEAKVITLMKDITVDSTIVINNGATFDLNGHKVTNTSKTKHGIYAFAGTETVTITDSSNEGTGTITNTQVTSSYGVINLRRNTVISGGNYNAATADGYVIVFTSSTADYTYEITDGTFNGQIKAPTKSSGKLTISGGTFSVDPSAYVKEDYVAVANEDGTYTVKKETEALKDELNDVNKELSDVKAELSAKATELSETQEALADKVAELEATKAKAEEDATKAAADIADLESQLAEMTTSYTEEKSAKEALETELATAKETLETTKATLSETETALTEAKEDLATTKASLEKVNKELADANKSNAELEASLKEVQESLEATTATLNETKDSLATANTTIDSLNETIKAKDAEIAELKSTIADRDATITALTSSLETKQQELADKVAELEVTKAKAEKDATKAAADIADLESQLAEMTTSYTEEKSDKEALETELATVKESLETTQAKLSKTETALTEAKEELATTKTALDEANKTIESTNASYAELEADLKETIKSLNSTIATLDETKASLTEANATIESLNATIATKEAKITELEASIAEKDKQIADLQDEVNKLKEEQEDTGKTAAEKAELEAQLEQARKEIMTLKTVKVSLSSSTLTYNGKERNPSVVVTGENGTALVEETDYTVTKPEGRTLVGTYTYTVEFQGDYAGTVECVMTIKPAKTSVSKLTAATKAFTVKWTKKSAQVTGYRIQYSTSSKFTKSTTKTVKVKSYKTISKKISKLKAKKKYYVRVQTYKTTDGKTYYSNWSAAKSVKTK